MGFIIVIVLVIIGGIVIWNKIKGVGGGIIGGGRSKKEEEYINAFTYALANDTIIDDGERRMLEQTRRKLRISKKRAEQLEAELQKDLGGY